MLLITLNYVPGKEIEALGIVKGTTVQTKNFGKDFMSGMKTLVANSARTRKCLTKPGRLPLSEWWTRRKAWGLMLLSTSDTVPHL